jgi:hypothetical protein
VCSCLIASLQWKWVCHCGILLHQPGMRWWCCKVTMPHVCMQAPCPMPTNATPKQARQLTQMGVLAAATLPRDIQPGGIVQVLQERFAAQLASSTAAKKACRRGAVMVNDLVACTTTEVLALA